MNVEYFEILGLEPRFTMDLAALEKVFHERSRQLHPDRFVTKPKQDQQEALDASATLNDAYRTLRDPVRRAEYMLEAHGIERSTSAPPELLEEVFELNMLLENTPDPDELTQAKSRFRLMQSEIDEKLASDFAKYDEQPDPAVLKSVRSLLDRRRYIDNLLRDVAKATA